MLAGKQLAAPARPSNWQQLQPEVTRRRWRKRRRHARHEVLLRAACTRAWARERAVHNSRLPRSTQADLYRAAWRPRGGLVALTETSSPSKTTTAIGITAG